MNTVTTFFNTHAQTSIFIWKFWCRNVTDKFFSSGLIFMRICLGIRFLVGICRPLFPTLLKGLHLLRPERQNRFATSYFLLLLKNSFMNLIFFLLFPKFIMQKDIEKCCSHKHSVVVWRFPPLYLQKQALMFPISLPRLYISCLYFYISCQATTVMKLFHNQLIYHNQVKKVSSQPQCGSV